MKSTEYGGLPGAATTASPPNQNGQYILEPSSSTNQFWISMGGGGFSYRSLTSGSGSRDISFRQVSLISSYAIVPPGCSRW